MTQLQGHEETTEQVDSRFDLKRYLKETDLLDYSHPRITELIKVRNWTQHLDEVGRIRRCYDFVRNEILFGEVRFRSRSLSSRETQTIHLSKTDILGRSNRH